AQRELLAELDERGAEGLEHLADVHGPPRDRVPLPHDVEEDEAREARDPPDPDDDAEERREEAGLEDQLAGDRRRDDPVRARADPLAPGERRDDPRLLSGR